jgi:hypothetical protein
MSNIKRDKQKEIIIFIIFFFTLCALHYVLCVPCFAQGLEKLTKLMPANTELISRKEDRSQQFITVIQYKYSSINTKEAIADFYRRFFTNEGFIEIQGYSPGKKPSSGPQRAYFFTKTNILITLNILVQPEHDLTIYYITLHAPDIQAIKSFDIKQE